MSTEKPSRKQRLEKVRSDIADITTSLGVAYRKNKEEFRSDRESAIEDYKREIAKLQQEEDQLTQEAKAEKEKEKEERRQSQNNSNQEKKEPKKKENIFKKAGKALVKKAGKALGKGIYRVGKGIRKTGKGIRKAGRGVQKAGSGLQKVGKGIHSAGKVVCSVAKAMRSTGRSIMQAGLSMIQAGAAACGTGIGAIVGVPMIIAGTAMAAAGTAVMVASVAVTAAGVALKVAGKAVQLAGKVMKIVGKVVEKAGKGLEKAGRSIEAWGNNIYRRVTGRDINGYTAKSQTSSNTKSDNQKISDSKDENNNNKAIEVAAEVAVTTVMLNQHKQDNTRENSGQTDPYAKTPLQQQMKNQGKSNINSPKATNENEVTSSDWEKNKNIITKDKTKTGEVSLSQEYSPPSKRESQAKILALSGQTHTPRGQKILHNLKQKEPENYKRLESNPNIRSRMPKRSPVRQTTLNPNMMTAALGKGGPENN